MTFSEPVGLGLISRLNKLQTLNLDTVKLVRDD